MDWSKHPLGLPSSWPDALWTILSLMCNSTQPMSLFWSESVYYFYNDACLAFLGEKKFMNSMGKKGSEIWHTSWPGVSAQVNQVMNEGASICSQDLLVSLENEKGKPTSARYYTCNYSPVMLENGQIFGALVTSTETTDRVLAEMKLEASQERLRATFQHTSVGVCLAKLDGTFLEVNPAFARMMDYHQDEMLNGLSIPQITYPEDLPNTLSKIEKLLAGETPAFKILKRYLKKNGSVFWAQSTVSVTKNTLGDPVNIVAVTEDVTDLQQTLQESQVALARAKKAESQMKLALDAVKESELQLRTMFDSMAQLAWMAHPNGQVFWYNRGWYEYTGKNECEMEGWDWQSIHDPEILPSIVEKWKAAIQSAQTFEMTYPRKKADGTFRSFLTRIAPVKDDAGKVVRWFGTSTDVEEPIRVQQELEKAKDEAEKANQLKSAFLANMSHEIRTPLGAMLGFADLITDPDCSLEDRKKYAQTLRRNGEQLHLLINDILDLSKIEAEYLKIETINFSLRELIGDVLSVMNQNALEKGLQLGLEIEDSVPDRVNSDPTRIKQVLFNIIGNAIKFTQKGEVSVLVSMNKHHLEIEVRDTGIGIAQEHQLNLFKPFTQADESMTRRFGGTGLGLALSKRLSQLLGGDLILKESRLGGGSTFRIIVKNHLSSSSSKRLEKKFDKQCQNTTTKLKGISVLFVDDSPDNQVLVAMLLRKKGAHVDIAENGLVAIEKAIHGDHDVVVMDVQMPVLDGYSATQRLRASGFLKPIVALTAHAMSEVREKCLNVGYSDYLPKPINQEELITTIAKYAGVKRAAI